MKIKCTKKVTVYSLDAGLNVTVLLAIRNKDNFALPNGCHDNEGWFVSLDRVGHFRLYIQMVRLQQNENESATYARNENGEKTTIAPGTSPYIIIIILLL